ncbi:hypothetical protein AAEP93_000173 [Penicillium crustosum]
MPKQNESSSTGTLAPDVSVFMLMVWIHARPSQLSVGLIALVME